MSRRTSSGEASAKQQINLGCQFSVLFIHLFFHRPDRRIDGIKSKIAAMESETAPSHDEIWDDSALVNSWNEALEEYKVRDGAPYRLMGALLSWRNRC